MKVSFACSCTRNSRLATKIKTMTLLLFVEHIKDFEPLWPTTLNEQMIPLSETVNELGSFAYKSEEIEALFSYNSERTEALFACNSNLKGSNRIFLCL
ncbi:hypothetical protein CEXT_419421 [Caerostris extrusa]|uniref:Uncharacterized protein n=1 Tax=Caerostris extrusa TaxID=172846 RepID=A0AAV4N4D8_CAEEX|nr:hypothetical protein CEXT_419421 [Caerostris extrusa]